MAKHYSSRPRARDLYETKNHAREIHVIIYTKENGKQHLTIRKWYELSNKSFVYHRIDGPAIKDDQGYEIWCKENKYHRIDGPAVVDPSNGHMGWFIEGDFIPTEEEFKKLIQEVRDMPLVLRLIDPRKWVREFK